MCRNYPYLTFLSKRYPSHFFQKKYGHTMTPLPHELARTVTCELEKLLILVKNTETKKNVVETTS